MLHSESCRNLGREWSRKAYEFTSGDSSRLECFRGTLPCRLGCVRLVLCMFVPGQISTVHHAVALCGSNPDS